MELMEMARELGMTLAKTEEYIRMTDAQNAVMSNGPLTQLVAELAEKKQSLVSLIQGDGFSAEKAMEISADLERLQSQLMDNPMFVEMTETQKTFSELLKAVDSEINSCIGMSGRATGSNGCSGNCAGCEGCAH